MLISQQRNSDSVGWVCALTGSCVVWGVKQERLCTCFSGLWKQLLFNLSGELGFASEPRKVKPDQQVVSGSWSLLRQQTTTVFEMSTKLLFSCDWRAVAYTRPVDSVHSVHTVHAATWNRPHTCWGFHWPHAPSPPGLILIRRLSPNWPIRGKK